MQISLKQGSKSNFTPKHINSIKELANIITEQDYSLGVFNENKRNNENFVKADFIGLDFDNGLSIDSAINRFSSYQCIIAPTKSHRKDKNGIVSDRFRVILKLTETITDPATFKATAMELLKLNPEADRACSDPARMFYPSTQALFVSDGGKTINITIPKKKTEIQQEITNQLNAGKLSKSTLEFIALGAPKGEWNPRLFKAAVDCMEQGYSEDDALALLYPATRQQDGQFDENDLKTISSAFNREAKYPPRLTQSCFNFLKPDQLTDQGVEQDWLVEGFLTRNGISIIAGSAKSGKSTLSRQLTRSVVTGTPFLGRNVKKGKVLYLALEEAEGMLKLQLKSLGITQEHDVMLHVGPVGGGNIEDSLCEAINAYKADLVVIDTLLLLAKFNNINDYNEVYTKMNVYCNIARKTGAHILCLHHQNKGQDRGANSILGSSAIMAAVDCFVIFGMIPGRQLFRSFNSQQRGGQMFVNQTLKYIPELDIYELVEGDNEI